MHLEPKTLLESKVDNYYKRMKQELPNQISKEKEINFSLPNYDIQYYEINSLSNTKKKKKKKESRAVF